MQNSSNQQDPDQDQRKNVMEDSNAMTIEFLRARLLSERSISKTARQRADELANRVVELEEQLRIVSLQRKKAEKATEDVLAILENHGISEFSEYDSSSDQEVIYYESKGNNSPEGNESAVGSKMRRSLTDEFSGSEPESSPLPGRSLSWKSGKGSLVSGEKYNNSTTRRRSSFQSASPSRRVGKSCRQIQRRETRSAGEKSQVDNTMLAPQDNRVASYSEGLPILSEVGPEILSGSTDKRDTKHAEGPVSGDVPVANSSNYLHVDGSDKDMERALEHQAQLIGQYEEEEKAQREWEEKFRENNNSTPDSCEPGNHSDVTEERDETKADAPPLAVRTIASQEQVKSKLEDVCATEESSKSRSDGVESSPHVDTGRVQDQTPGSVLTRESPASDFVFPEATLKKDQQYSGHQSVPSSHSFGHPSSLKGPTGNTSANVIPSHAGKNLSSGETSGSENENYALMPRETPNELGSVLEALHRAKLSLSHKLNTLPAVGGGSFGKAIEFSVGNRAEVPVGCAGLFRVPSDFHLEATNKANDFLGSNSQLRLTNYYPDSGNALAAVDRFNTSPNTESRSSVPTDDRQLAISSSLYRESRSKSPTWELPETCSRFSSLKPFVGSSDTGLPSTSRYAYNDPNMNTGFTASGTYASNSQFFGSMDTGLPSSRSYAYNDPNMNTGLSSSGTHTSHKPFFASSDTGYAYNNPNMNTGLSSSGTQTSQQPFFGSSDTGLHSPSRYAYNEPNMNTSLSSSGTHTSQQPFFGSSDTDLHSPSRYAYNNPNMNMGLSSSGTHPSQRPFFGRSETGPTSSSRYAYNDPNMNTGLISSGTLTSTYPFHRDLRPRGPSNEGPQPFSSSGAGMHPANQSATYDYRIRPHMYR